MIITLDFLKERNNALFDELRRIEGAMRENNHLIAQMKAEEQSLRIDSIEKMP